MDLKDAALQAIAEQVERVGSGTMISRFLEEFTDVPYVPEPGTSKVNSVTQWLKKCKTSGKLPEAILFICDPTNYINTDFAKEVRDAVNTTLRLYGHQVEWTGVKPSLMPVVPSVPALVTPPAHIKPNFAAISAPAEITQNLDERWDELMILLSTNAYRMTMVAIGGLMEGCILAKMENNPRDANTASNTPIDPSTSKPKAFKKWTLNEMIDVALELGWIHESRGKFSHQVRDYRNFVHVHKEVTEGMSIDAGACAVALEVLKQVVIDLS